MSLAGNDCMVRVSLKPVRRGPTRRVNIEYMSEPAALHSLTAPPWHRVEITMMTAARDVRAAYDLWMEPLGLNLSQAQILGFVNTNGAMNQTQLAAALVLGRAAVGSVIDQLEARGLVRRVPDPDDGRVWLVENTPAGTDVAAEVERVDLELRAILRCGISRKERQQAADLALRMSANTQKAIEFHKEQRAKNDAE